MRQVLGRFIGRHDHDGLLRHSFVVMVFAQLGGLLNVAFHVVMGHTLSQVEYGVLASMLGLVMIVAVPMLAIQNTLAHFAARLKDEGHAGAVRSLLGQWCRRLAWPAGLILVAGVLLSGKGAAFFHLEGRWPIVLAALACSGAVFVPVMTGALQGLQSFVWMSAAAIVWSVARLVFGWALVLAVGPWASAGLAAQAASAVVSVAVGAWGVRRWLARQADTGYSLPGHEEYFGKSLVALACFGFLMNADVVMVKHFFEPDRAGLFARAATIGRTVIFICQPIATALFPKVVSAGGASRQHRATLARAVVLSVLIIGGATLACVAFPRIPLLILFRQTEPTLEQIRLVRAVTTAMSPLGLTFLLLSFEMAQHRFKLIIPLAVCAAGYIAGVAAWHASLGEVVAVLGAAGALSAVALLALLPWRGGDVGGPAPAA